MQIKDLEFLQNPLLWPAWPLLPLKRFRGKEREFGYVVAQKGHLTEIRAGNIFAAKETDPVRWTYDTPEAMLADGWQVD